jgi:hypothetical protein
MHSEALRQVLALDQLHLLPSSDLANWKRQISGLRVCRSFHEGLLQDSPACPHCGLNPAASLSEPDPRAKLDQLAEALPVMLASWQRAVVSALDTETAKQSLDAMTSGERKSVQAFLDAPDAPTLPEGFIEAANKALRGIVSVPVTLSAVEAALRAAASVHGGGFPARIMLYADSARSDATNTGYLERF